MSLCPNAGGECVSSTCGYGSSRSCWKQSQVSRESSMARPNTSSSIPFSSNPLFINLAKELKVPVESICDGVSLKRDTLKQLEKETGIDLSYASLAQIDLSIQKFLNLKSDPWTIVTVYAHSDGPYDHRSEPQYAGMSEGALEALAHIVYEVSIKVKIHRDTGEHRILSVNGLPVDGPYTTV